MALRNDREHEVPLPPSALLCHLVCGCVRKKLIDKTDELAYEGLPRFFSTRLHQKLNSFSQVADCRTADRFIIDL